jgi:hypothetical protein
MTMLLTIAEKDHEPDKEVCYFSHSGGIQTTVDVAKQTLDVQSCCIAFHFAVQAKNYNTGNIEM